MGACYVLDEPSIGLHVRDTDRLIGILERLRDIGNTIVVVEHEAEVMRAADHVVDLGPGAGEHGGEVIFHGTYAKLVANGSPSLTGQYLSGRKAIGVPKERRKPKARKATKFVGCMKHNLKNIDVSVPVGIFTAVTGVSGSGKSTLVHDVIYEGLETARKKADGEANDKDGLRLPCRKITGAQHFNEVVLVDQSPIGRSPRSNPVTYVKAFDEIRKLFAATQEARKRSMTPGWFSFNVPGGRCETCQGEGVQTVEMQFLADVELVCEDCGGKRFGPKALEVKFDGKNIHDVLSMTVDEALRFFSQRQAITRRLGPLSEVGLGYSAAGAGGDDALGRRGAARKAGGLHRAVEQRQHAVHFRRADDGVALRRHREVVEGARQADRERRNRVVHRAQPRRDQVGGLGNRSGAGRRSRRRGDRRGGRAGRGGGLRELAHGAVPEVAIAVMVSGPRAVAPTKESDRLPVS